MVSVGSENPLLVEEGDTAAMLCEVDANPAVSAVRWTRAGRYVATSFRHVIPTVGREDAGGYTCQADNGLGRPGMARLNLSVLHGPRVTVPEVITVASVHQVESHDVKLDEPSDLSCHESFFNGGIIEMYLYFLSSSLRQTRAGMWCLSAQPRHGPLRTPFAGPSWASPPSSNWAES